MNQQSAAKCSTSYAVTKFLPINLLFLSPLFLLVVVLSIVPSGVLVKCSILGKYFLAHHLLTNMYIFLKNFFFEKVLLFFA